MKILITTETLEKINIFEHIHDYIERSVCVGCMQEVKILNIVSIEQRYITVRCCNCTKRINHVRILNAQEIFYLKCINRIEPLKS